jgi:hypothetical protein
VAPLNAIGLGVSVDEDLIARHRVAIAARS